MKLVKVFKIMEIVFNILFLIMLASIVIVKEYIITIPFSVILIGIAVLLKILNTRITALTAKGCEKEEL